MSQPSLSGYWSQVKARAALDFDFYLATKHSAFISLSPRTILARHRRSDGRLLEEAWRRYHELLGGSEENLSG